MGVKGWLVVTLLLGAAAYALAEELTLTTYYPSPRGVYQELRVNGKLGIGTNDPITKVQISGEGGDIHFGQVDGEPNPGLSISNRQSGGRNWGILSSTEAGFEGALRFHDYTASQTRMALDAGGRLNITGDASNLGIGLNNTGSGGSSWRMATITDGGAPGSGNQPGAFMIYQSTPENFPFTALPSGYVGLNHSNPKYPVTIYHGNAPSPVGTFTPTLSALYYADGVNPVFSVYTYPGPSGVTVFCPQDGAAPFGDYGIVCVGKAGNGVSIMAAGAVNSGLADFAERIPWQGERPIRGSVVNHKGSWVVVSSRETAAFVGNASLTDAESIIVAFAGQVPVRVTGTVNEGDYIVPNGDGTGKAIGRDAITFEQYRQVVGTAWETSDKEEEKKVNVAIGID